jgi:hypothetical protein
LVSVHAPEIQAWPEFETIEARAAVEVTLTDGSSSVASIEFTAATETNLDLGLIAFDEIELTAVNLSLMVARENASRFQAVIEENFRGAPQELPVEVVLSYVSLDAELPTIEGIQLEPPPIFYSTTPAVLLQTDGEPLLAPIVDTELQYVVNTNWDLFRYRAREWYLLKDSTWLTSDELAGPWESERRLPGDFRDLPADGNFTAALSAVPAQRSEEDAPAVFFSDRPAEMILLDGEPNVVSIEVADLGYVSNTTSDLFVYENDYYFLVSGRWFLAKRLRGPWESVAELPAAFSDIPVDHPRARVRASIPNTDEARLAALEALIPRKATVSRDAGDDVSVIYQGVPHFESIPGTQISRVTNSPNDVLLVDGRYYLCLNAVWYVSDNTDGPWEVTDYIPASVYSIPASSPAYHVTNVHVYESDEASVSTGYTGGYFGLYVSFGVAMYGTGYYYSPYHYYDPFYGYPIYYPYPYSYGSSAFYNPNTGMYGRSDAIYGPYGGYGRTAAYNPETGTYARGQAVWDGDEIAGSGIAYNPRTGTGIATNRYAYEDRGWGESLITRDDRWVYSESEWTDNSRRTEPRVKLVQSRISGRVTAAVQPSRVGRTAAISMRPGTAAFIAAPKTAGRSMTARAGSRSRCLQSRRSGSTKDALRHSSVSPRPARRASHSPRACPAARLRHRDRCRRDPDSMRIGGANLTEASTPGTAAIISSTAAREHAAGFGASRYASSRIYNCNAA